MMTSLALRGNSYHLVTERDKYEFATQLEPLHPDMVITQYNYENGQRMYQVDGTKVPNHDIVHIRRFSLPAALVGLSPIQQARQAIGLGLAADRYGARYFGDSANPSAVLSTDQDLPEATAERAQKSWIASHGGRRHPAMLSGGLKYEAISITPEESQFLQTRQFQAGEIAMLYGIPPHMLGQTDRTTSWGSGIEQQGIGFVRYTLRPWLSCIEAALSTLLPRNQMVKFDVKDLLRGDILARYQAYNQGRTGGFLSVNEIRDNEDLAPIADGDGYLQPLNMGPLGVNPLEADPAVLAAIPQDPSTDVTATPDESSGSGG
jgi:HK97 family phage portal protein